MCECKPDPTKQKLSFDQLIMLSQVILLNGCLLRIFLRLNCKLNVSYHTEVHYSRICLDDYSYRRMCSWTRWLSVSHSSCTLTFHKNSKGGRVDCCSVFVKSVARCQSRPRLRPCTRQLRLVLSRSLSPVPLKPADLYTQQVLNGRAGCRTPNLKWPLKETLEFCIIYRKQTSNQYSLSSFDIVLKNSRYVWDCSSWKQLIVATGCNWSSRSIWNLESRLSHGTRT